MKVFLLDDSSIMRGRLIRLLSCIEGVEIVGAAGDPIEAFTPIMTTRPDVVILDIRIGKKCGIDLLRRIGRMKPALSVIALSHRFYLSPGAEEDVAGPVDYFLDRFTQWRQVPEILNRIMQAVSMEPAGMPA